MHGGLPYVTDDLLPSAGWIGTASRDAPRNRCTRIDPATRFPAEAATCIGFARLRGQRLNRRDSRGASPDVPAGFRTRGSGSFDPPRPMASQACAQCTGWNSFPLTAAGQFRFCTGFPFNPASFDTKRQRNGHRRNTSYCVYLIGSTDYFALRGLLLRRVTGRGHPLGHPQADRRFGSADASRLASTIAFSARASSSSIAARTASTVLGPPPNKRIAVRAT